MTDNEIIKALECVVKGNVICEGYCDFHEYGYCYDFDNVPKKIIQEIYDLVSRQKTEIEKLKETIAKKDKQLKKIIIEAEGGLNDKHRTEKFQKTKNRIKPLNKEN